MSKAGKLAAAALRQAAGTASRKDERRIGKQDPQDREELRNAAARVRRVVEDKFDSQRNPNLKGK